MQKTIRFSMRAIWGDSLRSQGFWACFGRNVGRIIGVVKEDAIIGYAVVDHFAVDPYDGIMLYEDPLDALDVIHSKTLPGYVSDAATRGIRLDAPQA